MPEPIKLFASEIAGLLGIQVNDWHSRVSRGHAPEPDGYIRSRPYWLPDTIAGRYANPGRRGPKPTVPVSDLIRALADVSPSRLAGAVGLSRRAKLKSRQPEGMGPWA